MHTTILGATLLGIDAVEVEVEVKLQRGLMGKFLLSGLPDTAVRESRDRVRSAIQACSFRFPRNTLLAHFAPADLRKEGNVLDLPLALAVLSANEQLPNPRFQRVLAVGELALDGRVRPVRGILPIAATARKLGVDAFLAPAETASQAALVDGLPVYPVASLIEAVALMLGKLDIDCARPEPPKTRSDAFEDLADVRGQEDAKLAIAVGAAGLHNVLMVGPPGSGKTMLARRLRALLPALDPTQALECARISSVVAPRRIELSREPPFRAPHHTASPVALIGGGPWLRPGEITLAHQGVLFLDELPEFDRRALEALRQPLEERTVTISRAVGSIQLPADFCLVAAMNPCPCGYLGTEKPGCRCSEFALRRYSEKLSGPLLDRIDVSVEVPAIAADRLLSRERGESSAELKARIDRARELQAHRFAGTPIRGNGRMAGPDIERHCVLDDAGRGLLLKAAERQHLSARAILRALRVARTLADLRASDRIGSQDVALALNWRRRAIREESQP